MSSLHAIAADVLQNKHGRFVSVDRVRWPELPWEVANKSYVDFASGVGYTYVPPLHKDDGLLQVYVDDADATHKGVVTLTDQTFAGNKYFTGDVQVTQQVFISQTSPSSNNSAVTLAYVNQQLGSGLTTTAPIQRSAIGVSPIVLSVANAAATSPGVISGTAQTLGGSLTLDGTTAVRGPMAVSGASTFTGVATFTNAAYALTDAAWTSPGDRVANGTYVRQATLGAGYDSGNGWISDCRLEGGVTAGGAGTLSVRVYAGCFRFSDFQPGETVEMRAGPVVTHTDWAAHTLTTSYPALGESKVVSIYISDDSALDYPIVDLAAVSDTQRLYADLIQVGAVVLITIPHPVLPLPATMTIMPSVSNVKVPFADRTNISQAEIATLICPINLKPRVPTLTSGTSPSASLTLSVAAGAQIWEYGANGYINLDNRHLITLQAWNSNPNGIYHVWQDSLGKLRTGFPASTMLDTAQWNPLATGTALSNVTAGKYYNIPILYNPSANIYLQQYPTHEYTDLSGATDKAHAYTRMFGEGSARYLLCIGVVTYLAKDKTYMGTWTVAVQGTIYPTATSDGQFWTLADAGTMNYTPQDYEIGDYFAWNATTLRYDFVSSTSPAPAGVDQGAWDIDVDGSVYPDPSLLGDGDYWTVSVAGTMNYSPQAYVAGDHFVWNETTQRFDFVDSTDPLPADFSDSVISGGEFFNYQAAGGSGGGGSGGGGGGGIASVLEQNTAWLQAYECTTTGTMNYITDPFALYGNAAGQASLIASETNPTLIHLTAGNHNQNTFMQLRPFVSLAGFAMASTRVDLNNIANKITAHVSFGSTDKARVTIRDLMLARGSINYDLFAQGGQHANLSSTLDLYNVEVAGTSDFVCREYEVDQYYSGDEVRLTCVLLRDNATFDGGQVLINNIYMPDATADTEELKLQSTNCRLDCYIMASLLRNISVIGIAGSAYDINVTISSTFLQFGSYIRIYRDATYTGTITVNIDRGSIPYPETTYVDYDRTDAQIVFNVYDDIEPQQNIVYMSAVGDDMRNGANINNTVLTLPVALALSTSYGASAASPYTVVLDDASILAAVDNNCTFGTYCSVDAPSATMEGTMSIKAGSRVHFKAISGAITMEGGDATEPANYVICNSLTAAVDVDTAQPAFHLKFSTANGGDATDAILTVAAGSTAYMSGDAVTGLITATGAGAFIDVSGVRDLRNATFATASGGSIRYGPNFGANLYQTGMLKGTSTGELQTATPGTDYLIGTQALTLGGDVAASGNLTTNPILVTIAANAVEAGMIETAPAWSLLGRQTGSAGTPAWYTDGATLTANGAVMRNASGNILANHFVEGYKLVTFAANTQPVEASDAGFLRLDGTSGNLKLPDTTGLATGFSYEVYNGASGSVVVMNATNAAISTLATGDFARYTTNAASPGVWSAYPYYQTITLSGAVSGTGNQSIVTTAEPGATPLTALPQVTGPVALGSLSTSLGNVTAVSSAATAASANTFTHRDASGNSVFNHATNVATIIDFTTGGSATATATTGGFIRLTGISGTLNLPAKTGLATGFAYDVFNAASGNIDIRNSASTSQLVLASGDFARFVSSSTAASWDVYPYYQTITLSGAVTGSGNKSITTTIAANQVPLSGLPQITGPVVLGSLSTSLGNVTTVVSASTSATFDSIAHRNGSGNSIFNHAVEPYVLLTSGGVALTQSSPAYFQFSAAGSETMSLPATTGMTAGFKFSIFNGGAGALVLNNNGGGAASTIASNSYADVIWDTAGTPGWRTFPLRSTTSVVPVSSLETAPQWSLLARQTGSAGAAEWYTLGSANTANGVVARDASGNFACTHATETFATLTAASVSLSSTHPAFFQYSGAGTTYLMPPTASLATGFKFTIYNLGAGALELQNSTGTTYITNGTVPATSTADAIWDGASWQCYRYTSYDNVPAPTPSFTTILNFNITTGSQALILNGACTTTNSSTGVSLVAYNCTNMGTSGAMLVEYSAECVASGTATSGAFMGAFRAKYTHSASVAVLTPFISEIKDLDAGLSTCRISASNSTNILILQAFGQASTTVYWTGQMRITYRVW